MIIGYDASRAFVSQGSGVEEVCSQILINLAKIDHRNSYLVFTREQSKLNLPANFEIQHIKLKYLWTQIGLAAKTFTQKMDVLFVSAYFLPLFYKPTLKTVVMIYDFGSEYLPDVHSFNQRSYLHFMQKTQLQKATKIITISNSTKSDLISLMGVKEDKIAVVHLGVDREKFKIDTQRDSLKSFNLVPNSYFLFVGTVQPRKNLARLIQAFAISNYPCLDLVIVGSKGWLSDQIYKLPKKLGIENKVRFLGYVPDKDLPMLYCGAIALILPSLFEGFGLPILEAQACGCPVITSNTSSMPEVAGKGAIFVDPYNIDDIVKGMRKCQISNVKSQIVKAGFENVKRFSWEKCAAETLRVLESI